MKMKLSIKEIRKRLEVEESECNNYLKDLPHDIESVNELENMLSNNKDLARSYDLGRRDALKEIQKMLQEISDKS
tara:strand:+ start:622 stop:846 length:225 start_codon:yes stop_codon:yes gene_type:complete